MLHIEFFIWRGRDAMALVFIIPVQDETHPVWGRTWVTFENIQRIWLRKPYTAHCDYTALGTADMMLSIFKNFPCSLVFHYNRLSVMCQEKHINFMYLHMDLQCPTGSSSLKTASCLCFPATIYLMKDIGKNGLQGWQWFFYKWSSVLKVWFQKLMVLKILRFL